MNYRGGILLHDNAKSHVDKIIRGTIVQLGWETVMHYL